MSSEQTRAALNHANDVLAKSPADAAIVMLDGDHARAILQVAVHQLTLRLQAELQMEAFANAQAQAHNLPRGHLNLQAVYGGYATPAPGHGVLLPSAPAQMTVVGTTFTSSDDPPQQSLLDIVTGWFRLK